MDTGEFNAGSNPVMDWHPIQGEVEYTPSRFMLQTQGYRNWDKLRPGGPQLGKMYLKITSSSVFLGKKKYRFRTSAGSAV